MAYNVYVACDHCGEIGPSWINLTVPKSLAREMVEKEGWTVKRDGNGWYCPKCEKERIKRVYGWDAVHLLNSNKKEC